MKLEEIARAIANNANMPYVWEDVLNRLKNGKALPFKFKERLPPDQVVTTSSKPECADCDHYKTLTDFSFCPRCSRALNR